MSHKKNKQISILYVLSFCLIVLPVLSSSLEPLSPTNIPMSASISWWDTNYQYRTQLVLTNPNLNTLSDGTTIEVVLNTYDLVASGKMQAEGNDFRIIWHNPSNQEWIELNRLNVTAFNTATTRVKFQIQDDIVNSDSNYYIYYGNPSAINPPNNPSHVYSYFNNFDLPNGYLQGWSSNSGIWAINNNYYQETDTSTNARSLYQEKTFEDVLIETKVKVSGTSVAAGIIIRYLNDNKYFSAGIGIAGKEVAIVEGKVGGNYDLVADNGNSAASLNPNQWYNLGVCVENDDIRVYVDGIMKLEKLNTSIKSQGKVGLQSFTADPVVFDNFSLSYYYPLNVIANINVEEQFEGMILEEEDPLEMGEFITISIEFGDISQIVQVLLEYDEINHTMQKNGNKYSHTEWKPKKMGNASYKIHTQYVDLKWSSLEGNILVIDTKNPELLEIITPNSKLNIGDPLVIEIQAQDTGSGIQDVKIEYEETNHTMDQITSQLWRWDKWIPLTSGTYDYTIYIIDNSNNFIKINNLMYVEITDSTDLDPSDQKDNDDSKDSRDQAQDIKGLPITLWISICAIGIGSVVTISRFRGSYQKSDLKLNRRIVPLKGILKHIRAIGHNNMNSLFETEKDRIKKANESPANTTHDIEQLIEAADHAFNEGAFLEAATKYKQISQEFSKKGQTDLAEMYQKREEEICDLSNKREVLQFELNYFSKSNITYDTGKIVERIIDISRRLNDSEAIHEYESLRSNGK